MSEVNPAQDATINRRMTMVRHEKRLTRPPREQLESVADESVSAAAEISPTPLAAAANFMFRAGLPSILSGYTSGICGLLVGHPFVSVAVGYIFVFQCLKTKKIQAKERSGRYISLTLSCHGGLTYFREPMNQGFAKSITPIPR